MAEDSSFRVKNTLVVNGSFIANSTVVNAAAIIATSINATSINTATANATTSVRVGSNVTINTTTAFIGNTTVNTSITAGQISVSGATINSTRYSATANNANNLNNQPASFYTNATNISTGTLNTARLPATANITTAINVGANVNLTTSSINVGNSTVNVFINSTAIGVSSDPLVQLSDIGTAPDQIPLNQYLGTLAYQSDSIAVANSFAVGNIATFVANGNVGIGNSAPVHTLTVQGNISLSGGIHANGLFGTAGQVLHSNGTGVYWGADDGTVTSVATGSGLTGGPITTTGTVSVLANNGLSANASGLYVIPGNGIITANSTGVHVGAGSGVSINSTAVAVLANSGIVSNATGVFVNTAFIGTLTANNSTNFNSQPASFYTNATNLATGTVPVARLGSGTANSTTFLGGDQSYKTAVTSVSTGSGLSGGPIITTGTVSVLANNGLSANTTGVYVRANTGLVANETGLFVNAAYIATIAANSATGSLTNTFTVGTSAFFVANGNVGIGNTAPEAKLEIFGTGVGADIHQRNISSAFAQSPTLSQRRRRPDGIVLPGDALGIYSSSGYDGTNFIEATRITSFVDGTPGINSMPGRMLFSTTPAGSTTPIERIRITSTGAVNIGADDRPASLSVAGPISAHEIRSRAHSGEGGQISLRNPDDVSAGLTIDVSSIADEARIFQMRDNSVLKLGQFAGTGGIITMLTSSSERIRITATGDFLVGSLSTSYAYADNSMRWRGDVGLLLSRNTTADANQIVFFNPNGLCGGINTSGTSISIFTSSDYRLKYDVRPLSGCLATITALKPSTYKWNCDDSHGEGFIAHELAEYIPLAVTGKKDAIDSEGRIQPQGVDYSKIVVHLVAAVQELTAKLEAAEARIAKLEAN